MSKVAQEEFWKERVEKEDSQLCRRINQQLAHMGVHQPLPSAIVQNPLGALSVQYGSAGERGQHWGPDGSGGAAPSFRTDATWGGLAGFGEARPPMLAGRASDSVASCLNPSHYMSIREPSYKPAFSQPQPAGAPPGGAHATAVLLHALGTFGTAKNAAPGAQMRHAGSGPVGPSGAGPTSSSITNGVYLTNSPVDSGMFRGSDSASYYQGGGAVHLSYGAQKSGRRPESALSGWQWAEASGKVPEVDLRIGKGHSGASGHPRGGTGEISCNGAVVGRDHGTPNVASGRGMVSRRVGGEGPAPRGGGRGRVGTPSRGGRAAGCVARQAFLMGRPVTASAKAAQVARPRFTPLVPLATDRPLTSTGGVPRPASSGKMGMASLGTELGGSRGSTAQGPRQGERCLSSAGGDGQRGPSSLAGWGAASQAGGYADIWIRSGDGGEEERRLHADGSRDDVLSYPTTPSRTWLGSMDTSEVLDRLQRLEVQLEEERTARLRAELRLAELHHKVVQAEPGIEQLSSQCAGRAPAGSSWGSRPCTEYGDRRE